MTFLLLLLLACLVSAAEEPLPVKAWALRELCRKRGGCGACITVSPDKQGKFNTIYLAGKYMSITEENSQMRMLMREVKHFKQYRVMSMTFYVRKNGKCQLHTVWADKGRKNSCSLLWHFFHKTECPKIEETDFRLGTWVLRHASRHFPKIYFRPSYAGGLERRPSGVYLQIHFVSNTTIHFEVKFINDMNYDMNLTGALATGTNTNTGTKEMWEEYVKLTQQQGIPIENIENIYETDACPKLEL